MNVYGKALAWIMVVGVVVPPAFAQQPPPAPPPSAAPPPANAAPAFAAEELDQLVAPIALHPDSLLVQVLMASTYPLEVVQAARFVEQNAQLKGDALNQALQQHTWDDSVKSLVMFPEVLSMMNEKLDWMQKLGDAFLAQQKDVMTAVQRLRAKAQGSGQLKSTAEQNIIVEPAASPATTPTTTVEVVPAAPTTTVIRIEPSNPEVIYVPRYDPTVVYGAWPPAYPPYYPYPAGYFAAGAFTFMAGAAVGAALWGGANWGRGDVTINNSRVNNFTGSVNNRQAAGARVEHYNRSGTGASGTGAGGQNRSQWQHNPEHRKGAQYRDASTQQKFNRTGPANAQSREAFRGRTGEGAGGTRPAASQLPAGGQGARERAGGGGSQPSASIGDRGSRPSSPGATAGTSDRGARSSSSSSRPAGGFEGVGGSGRDAQSFSSRGNASRDSYRQSSSGASRAGSSAGGGTRSGGGAAGGGAAGGGGGGGSRGGGRR